MNPDTIFFAWIPGSMTQVTMRYLGELREVHVDRVAQLFGRRAMEGLYLTGRHTERLALGLQFRDL